ncbi:MAG: SRPBCC domain-containing protein [Gemmatimonadaceae bacterium]
MSANVSSTDIAPTSASDTELVMTRIFDAPRSLVFKAWTENEHLEQWQGAPMGMTVTVQESNIRPGGAFRVCMHAPDGVDHWLQGVYTDVTPPERLAFTHTWLGADGQPGKETLVTITFAEHGKKTELTLRQTGLPSAASRDGHSHGWNSTFDRLTGYLAELDQTAASTDSVESP